MTDRALGFRVSLFGVQLAVAVTPPPWRRRWTAMSCHGCRAPRSTWRRPTGVWKCGVPETSAGLEILVDGAVADTAPSPLAAIPRVQRALDEAVVRRQAGIAVVHGGVVGHDGRAILLPGPTGAGKSTLVAELVRRGALYFSDEYALIDGAGRVHPYPRPLLLRDESGDGRPVLATDLGGTVAWSRFP